MAHQSYKLNKSPLPFMENTKRKPHFFQKARFKHLDYRSTKPVPAQLTTESQESKV